MKARYLLPILLGMSVWAQTTPQQAVIMVSSNGIPPFAPLTSASGVGATSTTPTNSFVPMCSATGLPPYSQCNFNGGGSPGPWLPLAGGTMTGPILGATNLVTATLPTNYFAFEGDSRFAGGTSVVGLTCPNASNYSNGTSGYSCSIPGQVSNMPFFLNHGAVYNEGIGGTTIAQMNTNYPTYVHALSPAVTGKTGQLFIQTGYNDISASTALATMKSGIQSAWSTGHTDGWTVVMTTMLPGPASAAQSLQTQQFNDFIRAQSCDALNSTTSCWDLLVDYAAILPDNWNTAYYYSDHTHPLAGSYTLLAAATNQALATQQSTVGLVPVETFGSGTSNYRSQLSAQIALTSGQYNTAVGDQSESLVTSGGQNTAVGALSCNGATTQSNTECFGALAGQNATSNDSEFIGENACPNCTADHLDVFGYSAGGSATTANNSIFFGGAAGCTTCSYATLIGQSATAAAGTTTTTAIGGGANAAFSYSTAIGQGSTTTAAGQTMMPNQTVVLPGGIFDSLPLGLAKGTNIASGTTIAPVAPITHITGTTSIATITVPSRTDSQAWTGCLNLIFDGAVSTTTAGNIFAIYSFAAGRMTTACYDGSKWYFD